MNRSDGHLNFNLIDMVPGHQGLHTFRQDVSSKCPAGCGIQEKTEYVLVTYTRYEKETKKLAEAMGVKARRSDQYDDCERGKLKYHQ